MNSVSHHEGLGFVIRNEEGLYAPHYYEAREDAEADSRLVTPAKTSLPVYGVPTRYSFEDKREMHSDAEWVERKGDFMGYLPSQSTTTKHIEMYRDNKDAGRVCLLAVAAGHNGNAFGVRVTAKQRTAN